jgi:hypothetical protein
MPACLSGLYAYKHRSAASQRRVLETGLQEAGGSRISKRSEDALARSPAGGGCPAASRRATIGQPRIGPSPRTKTPFPSSLLQDRMPVASPAYNREGRGGHSQPPSALPVTEPVISASLLTPLVRPWCAADGIGGARLGTRNGSCLLMHLAQRATTAPSGPYPPNPSHTPPTMSKNTPACPASHVVSWRGGVAAGAGTGGFGLVPAIDRGGRAGTALGTLGGGGRGGHLQEEWVWARSDGGNPWGRRGVTWREYKAVR